MASCVEVVSHRERFLALFTNRLAGRANACVCSAMTLARICFLAVLFVAIPSAMAADAEKPLILRHALLFHASFDNQLDADFAIGDPKLYHIPAGPVPGGLKPKPMPGLPETNVLVHAKGEGKFGDALQFTAKLHPLVFFAGETNLGYNRVGWSGAVSMWLRLDPEKDLEPGYCDPLQFIAQGWDEGNMFVEFSKDHTPRHFRYAILPVKKTWNPNGRGWEDIPEKERPMVAVHRPPFGHETWTHVVFCFGNINSGRQDGFGQLFIDGKDQGAFRDWTLPFNWDESKSSLALGLSYVGWMDDIAVFNRALSATEVAKLFALKNGVRDLK
jgi:hypothetical protein